ADTRKEYLESFCMLDSPAKLSTLRINYIHFTGRPYDWCSSRLVYQSYCLFCFQDMRLVLLTCRLFHHYITCISNWSNLPSHHIRYQGLTNIVIGLMPPYAVPSLAMELLCSFSS